MKCVVSGVQCEVCSVKLCSVKCEVWSVKCRGVECEESVRCEELSVKSK